MPLKENHSNPPHRDALNPLLHESVVAEILGVSPGTLRVWRSTGRYNLRFVKVGRHVRYRREDVESFINSRTMEHTNAPSQVRARGGA